VTTFLKPGGGDCQIFCLASRTSSLHSPSMDYLIIVIVVISLSWLAGYLHRQSANPTKAEKEHARTVGIWHLKGIVYECGSVTDLLERDSMLQSMMVRGYVREGKDTDKGARFLLDCRIEITRELVAKAFDHLKQSRQTTDAVPTSNEIDQLLMSWLGPTKTKLTDDTSVANKQSGINKLYEKWALDNLGEAGGKLYEYFLGTQLEKVKTARISKAESEAMASTMYEKIQEYEQLRRELEGGRDNSERKRLNQMFLALAKECDLKAN